MAKSFFRIGMSRLWDGQDLKNWSQMADQADDADLDSLRSLRNRARALRRRLDKVIHVADGRLALPVVGNNAVRQPLNTDWAHRPEPWRGPVTPSGIAAVPSKTEIGHAATIYHDCRISELSFRQIRNQEPEDLAPFAVRLDVFRFDGSFLSIAIDLPAEATLDMTKSHTIRVDGTFELEAPLEIFARLNIKNGPNTEQIVREFPSGETQAPVEFDLAYATLNEKRIEKAWIDLIFEGPDMNQITVRDLTVTRRPRADF